MNVLRSTSIDEMRSTTPDPESTYSAMLKCNLFLKVAKQVQKRYDITYKYDVRLLLWQVRV